MTKKTKTKPDLGTKGDALVRDVLDPRRLAAEQNARNQNARSARPDLATVQARAVHGQGRARRRASALAEMKAFEMVSDDYRTLNAKLAADGFVYAPEAEAWLHPDGREARVWQRADWHQDSSGWQYEIKITSASPMPDINFSALGTTALRNLREHAREPRVREAARAEHWRRIEAEKEFWAAPSDRALQDELTDLAREHLPGITTLEVRNSDGLDFHDCGVAGIRAALLAAYTAGFVAGKAAK
jgi:hypothetical protein